MTELRTAAQAAAERGVSESRMRGLLAEHGVTATARQPGRDGVNLYDPADLAAIPSPQQGTRNDILGQRIGLLFAAGRELAELRDARDEYDKIFAQCLAGNPRAVAMLVVAARHWAKRAPRPVRLLARVQALASQVGELPELLPMSARATVITTDAAQREAP